MPRPRKIDRPRSFHVSLPESVLEAVAAELHSPLEGCVPKGAYTNLFTNLAKNWLHERSEARKAQTNV